MLHDCHGTAQYHPQFWVYTLFIIWSSLVLQTGSQKLSQVGGWLSPGCLVGNISHHAWVAAALLAIASIQMQKGRYL